MKLIDLKPAVAGAIIGQKSVPNAFGNDKFKKAKKAPKVKKSHYGVDGTPVGGGSGTTGGGAGCAGGSAGAAGGGAGAGGAG